MKIFTKDINRIHSEWTHLGLKKVCYGTFLLLKPSHIVKRDFIALTACDTCTLFDCTNGDDCIVCILLEISTYDLLQDFCCDYHGASYLDNLRKLPSINCAYSDCSECKETIYEQILYDDELLSIPSVFSLCYINWLFLCTIFCLCFDDPVFVSDNICSFDMLYII